MGSWLLKVDANTGCRPRRGGKKAAAPLVCASDGRHQSGVGEQDTVRFSMAQIAILSRYAENPICQHVIRA